MAKNPEDRFSRHQAQIISNVAKQEIIEAKHQIAVTSKDLLHFRAKDEALRKTTCFLYI